MKLDVLQLTPESCATVAREHRGRPQPETVSKQALGGV